MNILMCRNTVTVQEKNCFQRLLKYSDVLCTNIFHEEEYIAKSHESQVFIEQPLPSGYKYTPSTLKMEVSSGSS